VLKNKSSFSEKQKQIVWLLIKLKLSGWFCAAVMVGIEVFLFQIKLSVQL